MLRTPVVFLTGASGEIGHTLIERLSEDGSRPVITLDLKPLDPSIAPRVTRQFTGSILDHQLLERILSEFEVDQVFHLAALLSTRSEFTPVTAHQVNVEGTMAMLEFAQRQGESHGRPVVFMYPSSIAAYGMPGLDVKAKAGRVKEDDFTNPTTMYGCNKLYCEQLGRYYARHYKQLAPETLSGKVDFRVDPLPRPHLGLHGPVGRHVGLRPRDDPRRRVRASPTPASSGPTRGSPSWRCPTPSTPSSSSPPRPREKLTRTVYNIGAFAPSAAEVQAIVEKAFPERRDHDEGRREAPGDRRLLARRRRRLRGPEGLGPLPPLRPRPRLPGVPDPEHPQALPGLTTSRGRTGLRPALCAAQSVERRPDPFSP